MTVSVNAYEGSDLRRFRIALESMLHTYTGGTNGIYEVVETYRNGRATYRDVFRNKKLFRREKVVPRAIKFLLAVDAIYDRNTFEELDVMRVFKDFCYTNGISNYKIVLAKHNYRVQIMRNIVLGICDTDFMTFSDDDDIHGISIVERYKRVCEKCVQMKFNPATDYMKVNFSNVIWINNDTVAPPVFIMRTVAAMWSKVYSRRLCELLYHIPSLTGGEDFVTNKRIVTELIRPRVDLKNVDIKPSGLYVYLWFQSGRNFYTGTMQQQIANLHARRYNFKMVLKKMKTNPNQTIEELQRYIDKIQKGKWKDKAYHEDEVVEYMVEGESGSHATFIMPRVIAIGMPPRKVNIQGNYVIVKDKQGLPSWVKDNMTFDYWNDNLKKTPYSTLM